MHDNLWDVLRDDYWAAFCARRISRTRWDVTQMTEIQSRRNEIAPSLQALLAAYHEDTPSKLELAPVDSAALYPRADGSLCEIGPDGWLTEYDDLDNDEAITIEPTSVHDIEEP